jgi:hypothetical protein
MRLLSCPLCLHPHHSQPPTGSPVVLPGDADKEATMRSCILALLFYVCLGLTFGCMTPKNDADDLPPAAAHGAGNSLPGSVSKEDEEWTKMGREMRGADPPPAQTFDPLRDLMESPRAQSIERSLGVDN